MMHITINPEVAESRVSLVLGFFFLKIQDDSKNVAGLPSSMRVSPW